ncbi:hypothetical protein BG004_005124 [Podila humilis]|nr:hypothetical protein BG004_005124 [Podila humilis]
MSHSHANSGEGQENQEEHRGMQMVKAYWEKYERFYASIPEPPQITFEQSIAPSRSISAMVNEGGFRYASITPQPLSTTGYFRQDSPGYLYPRQESRKALAPPMSISNISQPDAVSKKEVIPTNAPVSTLEPVPANKIVSKEQQTTRIVPIIDISKTLRKLAGEAIVMALVTSLNFGFANMTKSLVGQMYSKNYIAKSKKRNQDWNILDAKIMRPFVVIKIVSGVKTYSLNEEILTNLKTASFKPPEGKPVIADSVAHLPTALLSPQARTLRKEQVKALRKRMENSFLNIASKWPALIPSQPCDCLQDLNRYITVWYPNTMTESLKPEVQALLPKANNKAALEQLVNSAHKLGASSNEALRLLNLFSATWQNRAENQMSNAPAITESRPLSRKERKMCGREGILYTPPKGLSNEEMKICIRTMRNDTRGKGREETPEKLAKLARNNGYSEGDFEVVEGNTEDDIEADIEEDTEYDIVDDIKDDIEDSTEDDEVLDMGTGNIDVDSDVKFKSDAFSRTVSGSDGNLPTYSKILQRFSPYPAIHARVPQRIPRVIMPRSLLKPRGEVGCNTDENTDTNAGEDVTMPEAPQPFVPSRDQQIQNRRDAFGKVLGVLEKLAQQK